MRIKKIHLFIFPIILFLFFGLFFISSCEVIVKTIDFFVGDEGDIESDRMDRAIKEAEATEEIKEEVDEAVKEVREEIDDENEPEHTEESGNGDSVEDKLPNEPITYNGEFEGAAITLIVNFKTTSVSGSVSADYLDATITGGIDIDTYEVTTNLSGTMELPEFEYEGPFNGTITGIISEDFSTFDGEILNDEGDGGEFTAIK